MQAPILTHKPPSAWQLALQHAVTDPKHLWQQLNLDPKDYPAGLRAHQAFSVKIPQCFIARMKPGDPTDPLLRQVLPLGAELESAAGFSRDPLQESSHNPLPGLLHKYQGRVLLTVTGGCGVHCRYCFRRYFPYGDNNPGWVGWHRAIDYIAERPDIHEVILSGGDPLLADDDYLDQLLGALAVIEHVTTIRVHTRMPIVIPSRITPALVKSLQRCGSRVVVVLHCNHGNEIDSEVIDAVWNLREAQFTVLNQPVLLKGVNDSAAVLANLSHRLFAMGVLPYYLHLLDRVQGTSHFEVDDTTACNIVKDLMVELPGYLVPKLVREIPGMPAKVPVAVNFSQGEQLWQSQIIVLLLIAFDYWEEFNI